MKNISTPIGKIYCKSTGENTVDTFRIVKMKEKDDGTKTFIVCKLNEDNKFSTNAEDIYEFTEEELSEFIKSCDIQINSKGIISLSNVVSATTPAGTEIKDIIMIYFPNNKMTRIPDAEQPYIVARQGFDDFFSNYFSIGYGRQVGVSVSLDTLPNGYTLSDFLANDRVMSSYLTHVYSVDDSETLSYILDNDTSDKILKDLYDDHIKILKKSKSFFPEEYTAYKSGNPVDGYNRTLKEFIDHVFLEDLYISIGITKVDFEITEGIAISDDDKLLLSTLYGGIRINKAIPLKFEFDIDMKSIKMKYMLICDKNNKLFIIPYTESNDEIPIGLYEKITEEQQNIIRERLRKCVSAYDK